MPAAAAADAGLPTTGQHTLGQAGRSSQHLHMQVQTPPWLPALGADYTWAAGDRTGQANTTQKQPAQRRALAAGSPWVALGLPRPARPPRRDAASSRQGGGGVGATCLGPHILVALPHGGLAPVQPAPRAVEGRLALLPRQRRRLARRLGQQLAGEGLRLGLLVVLLQACSWVCFVSVFRIGAGCSFGSRDRPRGVRRGERVRPLRPDPTGRPHLARACPSAQAGRAQQQAKTLLPQVQPSSSAAAHTSSAHSRPCRPCRPQQIAHAHRLSQSPACCASHLQMLRRTAAVACAACAQRAARRRKRLQGMSRAGAAWEVRWSRIVRPEHGQHMGKLRELAAAHKKQLPC